MNLKRQGGAGVVADVAKFLSGLLSDLGAATRRDQQALKRSICKLSQGSVALLSPHAIYHQHTATCS